MNPLTVDELMELAFACAVSYAQYDFPNRADAQKSLRDGIEAALADAYDTGMRKGSVWGLAKVQPKPEPVGWLDAPHAVFRANPNWQWESGPTTLSVSIPVFLHPAVQGEPVALREVGLNRDVSGMCIVTINGREAIRDNGDVISHYATLDWFAQPPAPLTLTQDQIMEYVREAGLDWHRGWVMGEPPVNRYEEFARAVLKAQKEKT